MHIIDEKIMTAFWQGKKFYKMGTGRTEVRVEANKVIVYLHGNRIAEREGRNLRIDMCGWHTSVTKSRLNAILSRIGYKIFTRNGQLYMDRRGVKYKFGETEIIQLPERFDNNQLNMLHFM